MAIAGFEGVVDVEIYDLQGRLVDDIRVNSSGVAQWNARRASTGVYFVRIQSASGEVVTKKVSRLK